MGLLKSEKKSKKKWIGVAAALGAVAAAVGIKKRRSSSAA